MIPIIEYKFKQEPKEIAEFRREPKDNSLMEELEQSLVVENIIKCARVASELVSEIKSGDLDLNNIPFNDIQYGIRVRNSCRTDVDEFYSQLNESYKELVKDAYKQFLVNNLFLVNKLERKLRGE